MNIDDSLINLADQDDVSFLKNKIDHLENILKITVHDLREPLRAISGFLQLVLNNKHNIITTESQEYLNLAVRNISRLNLFIVELLSNYNIYKKRTSFDLGDLLKESVELLGHNSHTLPITYTQPLPRVSGNPLLIQHVFMNLIHNAIQHTQKTPLHLWLTYNVTASLTHTLTSSLVDQRVYLCLTDHEQGADHLKTFVHNPQTTSSDWGIGLNLCYHFIELHGGKLVTLNEGNQGFTVLFSLPLDISFPDDF